jgi:hypothetical protein
MAHQDIAHRSSTPVASSTGTSMHISGQHQTALVLLACASLVMLAVASDLPPSWMPLAQSVCFLPLVGRPQLNLPSPHAQALTFRLLENSSAPLKSNTNYACVHVTRPAHLMLQPVAHGARHIWPGGIRGS